MIFLESMRSVKIQSKDIGDDMNTNEARYFKAEQDNTNENDEEEDSIRRQIIY